MLVIDKNRTFEPRIKPTSEETYNYLKGYRRPNYAFVLFEKQEIKVQDSQGGMAFGTGLFTLNLEYRPEQITKIQQYIGKGFKILHFDNFPGVHRKDSASEAKAKLYCHGESKANPWEEVASFLESQIQNNPHWKAELKEKEDKLHEAEKRLAEMEKKLEKLDKAAGKEVKEVKEIKA